MTIHRKSTRLPHHNYIGQQSYFVTTCCDRRNPYLANPQIAERTISLLHECATKYFFKLHAYCVMPDHVHLLVEGISPQSRLREFMRVFKLRTAFEFRQLHNTQLWEMDYYDHILRPNDALEDGACYIWWNPVRKNLCKTPQDYQYSGSQTIPWMKRVSQPFAWSAPWKQKTRI